MFQNLNVKNIEKTIEMAALLHRYHQQQLNETERQKLTEWLEASPENRAQFKRVLRELKGEHRFIGSKYDLRVEVALDRVKGKLNKSAGLSYKRYLPYAAAIVLIILSTIIYQTNYGAVEILTAKAETKKLYLADGTQVVLEPDSKLSYHRSFGKSDRSVTLEGGAYFRVAKNQRHPFSVSGKTVKVDVLGTSFRLKNYAGDEEATVQVTSGKVRVEATQRPASTAVLEYGEELVYDKHEKLKTKKYDKKEIAKIDAGIRVYEGESLKRLIRDLERSYGVQINCAQELQERLFFGDLDTRGRLSFFLDKLAMTVHATWKKTGDNQYSMQQIK